MTIDTVWALVQVVLGLGAFILVLKYWEKIKKVLRALAWTAVILAGIATLILLPVAPVHTGSADLLLLFLLMTSNK